MKETAYIGEQIDQSIGSEFELDCKCIVSCEKVYDIDKKSAVYVQFDCYIICL